jgi:hypothetical protein
VFIYKLYNQSETEFYFSLKVERTQLGPIDRACPYLDSDIWTRSVDREQHSRFHLKMETECTLEALSVLSDIVGST